MNQKEIDKILETHFFPPNLSAQETYITTHDDNDGDKLSGLLQVSISCDGDVWIDTYCKNSLRYRTFGGGGQFLKIRNALLLLAEAIRQEGIKE